MIPQDIIRRKRDGERLAREDIAAFIGAMARNEIAEAQVGAFAMACWFRGMTPDETVALTLAMRDSGEVLSWQEIGRPVADKHSTGGIGDNVSLMLAPIAAACGLAVPMISGRGLGHTGGTLDKLESIPGYAIMQDAALFRRTVKEVGCAIIGQTAALAPADKRLYAIRDVTATVDSVPLITASILSKKLAAGLETLTLDVKIGNGAFMTTAEEAQELAQSLVDVANGAGVRTAALMTDMNQPLADAAGNAVEMRNCVDFLKGLKGGTRLETVVLAFAAEMLVQSGLAISPADGELQAVRALQSGRAAEIFGRMVHALGGPADFVERSEAYLPRAPVEIAVTAERDGWLSACNARDIGMSVIELGGGRRLPTDAIDHRVGFDRIVPLGTWLQRGDRIAMVHAADQASGEKAALDLAGNYRLSVTPPGLPPVIVKRVDKSA
ncbi:thymidine phosphorylase [Metarhizobium album]|uniref:Thymidine phosphorylase n=1 Tax=Metarhizobium album TaxID=2182425 RepID=A0A2U2DS59_9HYPH|nr:thymidine phosphorylase [Rhizobium album]PWE56128.1 thymidine phosphorylase [Rhizobium album]